jgi:hypothetical protein
MKTQGGSGVTPAEEMRAAAKLLRDRAQPCTQGPWRYSPGSQRNDYDTAEVIAEEGGWIVATSRNRYESDFVWIALMGPDKAELLATWLETEAHCVGVGDGVGEKTSDLLDAIAGEPLKLSVTVVADTAVPALAFARAVLGGAS